ncbi:MAG: type II secretion system F family protein [Bacillota bacterium]|nr:type II secretion system F family protein [Bacillota bacterium]
MLLLIFSITGLSAFIFIIILNSLFANKILIDRRLKALSGNRQQISPKKSKQNSAVKKPSLKFFSSLAAELSTAGIIMRPEEYLTLWIILAVIPAALVAMARGSIVTVIGLAAIGLITPPLIVRRKKAKRILLFEKQLGDALMVACNCLRSGLTFIQAMESIASEMSDPISGEFLRTLREIRLGSSFERAMESLSKRVPSEDLMLLVSAVLIQRQVGGNLSEILETISSTIQERIKLKDDIRVLTATGRASGIVIGCLPIGIALLLMLLNPGYIESFFNTSTGIHMLIVAGVMEFIGFLFVRHIVSIKY